MQTSISNNDFDVIVVGGGPAGASAAYQLSKNGTRVLLFEKEKIPRYKTCGGGIVGRIKNILPFDFEEIIEKKCFSVNVICHHDSLKFVSEKKEPIIMMTMRENFDHFLISKVKSFGTVVKDECEVKNVYNDNDGVIAETIKGKFKAKFLISADGAIGKISKKNLVYNHNFNLPALEYEVLVEKNIYLKFCQGARFDFDIISDGYGWVFPKRDHLSIGVISMKRKNLNLNKILDEYLKILGIENFLKVEKHGFIIPISNRKENYSQDRILFTGDSVGLADPVTAEGITNSILSGFFAADSIIQGNFNKNLVAKYYNKKIKQEILHENKYAKIISTIIYNFPRLRFILFRLYGQKLCELITDIFIEKKKYSTQLLNPLNYLKLIKYIFVQTNQVEKSNQFSKSPKYSDNYN